MGYVKNIGRKVFESHVDYPNRFYIIGEWKIQVELFSGSYWIFEDNILIITHVYDIID